MRHIKAHGKIRRVIINTVKHRILKQYPSYEIYEDGTVIRKEHTSYNGYKLKRVKITPYIAHNRYLVVNLHDTKGNRKAYYLHRLVWEAFNGEIPKGLEVAHEDCNRQNCKLDNLQLKSHSANCRNPESIKHYKAANALDKGKFNRELMEAAKSKENKERLKREHMLIQAQNGAVGVWEFMNSAHCNYYTALKVIGEMNGKMGASQ